MAKLMFQFRHPGDAPRLEDVMSSYGLESGEVDEDYGVVEIDPADSSYVILVEESAMAKLEGSDESEQADQGGTFSNPRIEPFGPPQP